MRISSVNTFLSTLLLCGLLVTVALGCEEDVAGPINGDDPELRQTSYELAAVENEGELPGGVAATATFYELPDNQTLVELTLEGGSTESGLIHPAHIHENSAEEGGGIVYFLGPIDGLEGSPGASYRVLDVSFDELVDFDGYINIHQSNAALGTIVSQGNIGANAEEDITDSTLDLIEDPRSTSYDLQAVSNQGGVPEGVNATATFREFTDNWTLVTLELEGGSTETQLAHPAHIHENSVEEGGGIVYFLGPIDGLQGSGGVSDALVDESYDALTAFDGHVNIHESNQSLGTIVSQGNIGANVDE